MCLVVTYVWQPHRVSNWQQWKRIPLCLSMQCQPFPKNAYKVPPDCSTVCCTMQRLSYCFLAHRYMNSNCSSAQPIPLSLYLNKKTGNWIHWLTAAMSFIMLIAMLHISKYVWLMLYLFLKSFINFLHFDYFIKAT